MSDSDTRDLQRAAQAGDAKAQTQLAIDAARQGKRNYLPPVHTSPETGFVQAGYPYGFRGKCLRRCWIETKRGHGQRFVTQTSKPYYPPEPAPDSASARWNKPKASTYREVLVLYLDEKGHIQQDGASAYDKEEVLTAFETRAAAALGHNERKALEVLRAHARALSRVKWGEVREVTPDAPRQSLEEQVKIIGALTTNELASARGKPLPYPKLGTAAKPAPEHKCDEHPVPYESDGALGHGWECGICGAFLQAG